MGLIVALVMLVLLFVAFGSLVLPLKAVVMNLFSISASFGVVTWIFGDGRLAGLLGFTPQGFLDATNPILMLAILFGLSMDYEVFLLSRVREQWDRTGDSDLAVATGVQKTGRIITSAAVLLGVVIGAFAISGIVFMKMLGIGMLVALLVDATVVRAMLVPATMKLLGRRTGGRPAAGRWWERYGFREGEEAGPAARTPTPSQRASDQAEVVRDLRPRVQTDRGRESRTTPSRGSGHQHVAAADAALGYRGVRLRRARSRGRTAATRAGSAPGRGTIEQAGQGSRRPAHPDRLDVDAPLRRGGNDGLYADEPPAVADQGHRALLQHRRRRRPPPSRWSVRR